MFLFNALRQNPIIYYSLYGRRADWRLIVSLALTALVYSPVILMIGYSLLMAVSFSLILYVQDPQAIMDNLTWEIIQPFIETFFTQALPLFAKAAAYATVMLTLILLILFAPTMSASLISSERQRQTLEVLLITLLPSEAIILGKMMSVLVTLLIPLAAIWVLLLICYALHGISFSVAIVTLIFLLVTSISFTALGLTASAFTKGITTTMMVIYGMMLPVLFIIPPLLMSMLSITVSIIFESNNSVQDVINFYGWGLVASLNPLMAAGSSATIYEANQGLFFIDGSPVSSNSGWLLSPTPWLVYVIFYTLLTLICLRLSMWQLNRLSQAK